MYDFNLHNSIHMLIWGMDEDRAHQFSTADITPHNPLQIRFEISLFLPLIHT
jgi:hypothetical protein